MTHSMKAPGSYAASAAKELALAQGSGMDADRTHHQQRAQTWATLALAAAIERGPVHPNGSNA